MKWHFYDVATGHFADRIYEGCAERVAQNALPGCKAIAGDFDHARQRVNPESGEVETLAEPRGPVESAASRRIDAMAEILRLEQRQARRVREILAASDPQLAEIDAQIAQLRARTKTPPGGGVS
jgi:hypothetical protein